ncbi:MAG: hypothetical protein ABIX01_17745 [Chitinophagaceae bacterium]
MKLHILVLFILFSSTAALGQWKSDPMVNNTVAVNDSLSAESVVSVSDGAGGNIMFFINQHYFGNHEQYIMAQRISSNGVIAWGDTLHPVAICTALGNRFEMRAVADAAGGAFVSWADYRHDANKGEIYTQHINASGIVQWAANGLRVTTLSNTNDTYSAEICRDGGDGIILGYSSDDLASNVQAYGQHINAAGTLLWGANGVQACTVPGFRGCVGIATDNNSGAILMMVDTRNDVFGLDYDSLNTNDITNLDIYAQRLDGTGNRLWTTGGVAICTAPGNQDAYSDNSNTGSDGSGGAFIFFNDFRNDIPDSLGNSTNSDVFGQRVDASGAAQWTANGLALSTAAGNQYIESVTQAGTDMVACWADMNTPGYWSQKVNAAGVRSWALNGVLVTPPSAYNCTVTGDGTGNFIYGFHADMPQFVGAQKLNAAGTLQWGPNGALVSSGHTSYYPVPQLVPGLNQSTLISWSGYSAFSSESNVYASNILPDGTLAGSLPIFTTIANGNWNNPAIWAGNQVPDLSSIVTVHHAVAVTATAQCYSLKVDPVTASVTVKSGVQLTVTH